MLSLAFLLSNAMSQSSVPSWRECHTSTLSSVAVTDSEVKLWQLKRTSCGSFRSSGISKVPRSECSGWMSKNVFWTNSILISITLCTLSLSAGHSRQAVMLNHYCHLKIWYCYSPLYWESTRPWRGLAFGAGSLIIACQLALGVGKWYTLM